MNESSEKVAYTVLSPSASNTLLTESALPRQTAYIFSRRESVGAVCFMRLQRRSTADHADFDADKILIRRRRRSTRARLYRVVCDSLLGAFGHRQTREFFRYDQ